MPTFLTTSKMSPELAERVRISVAGRASLSPRPLRARLTSVLRVGGVVAAAAVIALVVWQRRESARQLAEHRAELLRRLDDETGGVTAAERGRAKQLERLLAAATGAYAGDSISEELSGEQRFAEAFAQPSVYVRGPLTKLSGEAGMRQSAAESFKDAFVSCLVDPPATRTERSLRSRARGAGSGDERVAALSRIERLHPLLVAMPFFEPGWRARAANAATGLELDKLQAQLGRAPLLEARRVMHAERFLYVVDEPPDTAAPAELDGERPHFVRVGLVELAGERDLLRLRLRVDPSWISAAGRAEYASGIDSCALALDVRARAGANVAPRASGDVARP